MRQVVRGCEGVTSRGYQHCAQDEGRQFHTVTACVASFFFFVRVESDHDKFRECCVTARGHP